MCPEPPAAAVGKIANPTANAQSAPRSIVVDNNAAIVARTILTSCLYARDVVGPNGLMGRYRDL